MRGTALLTVMPPTAPKCSNGVLSSTAPTKGVLLTCTIPHQEFLPAAPVTLTRTFGVYIPPNYAPCDGSGGPCSGLILKVQGTTHGVTQDCNHAPAVSENAGWLGFLDAVPIAAPVMVCAQGLFDQLTATVSDPGERWNEWGFGNSWNWRPVVASDGKSYAGNQQIRPNDEDFLLTITVLVRALLQTDPKYSVVTNDWLSLGSLMAYQMAALHPDLFNAVVVLNDPWGSPSWTGNLQSGYTDSYTSSIPLPRAPINVLIIAGIMGSEQSLCGGAGNHSNWGVATSYRPFTVDDTIAYWNAANQPDTFVYQGGGATKFCKYVANSSSAATNLWRYIATNSNTGVTTEVWNLYSNRGTPYCSFGPDGNVVANMCAATNPPVDWRLVNPLTHTPGNPYADSTLGYSLLQIEFNFMNRSRRP